MSQKNCIGCSKGSPEVKFTLIKATGKLKARCNTCCNADRKAKRLGDLDNYRKKEQAYREANKERIRDQYSSKEEASNYYQANKDSILQRHNEYNKANAEAIKCQKREYYKKNKEEIRKRSAEYYETHKEEVYRRNAHRRARKLQATPGWLTKEDWLKMNLLYKIASKVTQLTGIQMHVDHIYPLQGKTVCGFHCPSNLQVITEQENLEKGASFPDKKYIKDYNGSNKATNIGI